MKCCLSRVMYTLLRWMPDIESSLLSYHHHFHHHPILYQVWEAVVPSAAASVPPSVLPSLSNLQSFHSPSPHHPHSILLLHHYNSWMYNNSYHIHPDNNVHIQWPHHDNMDHLTIYIHDLWVLMIMMYTLRWRGVDM